MPQLDIKGMINLAFGKTSDIVEDNLRLSRRGQTSLQIMNNKYHLIATITGNIVLTTNKIVFILQTNGPITPHEIERSIEVDIDTIGENETQDTIVQYIRKVGMAYGLIEMEEVEEVAPSIPETKPEEEVPTVPAEPVDNSRLLLYATSVEKPIAISPVSGTTGFPIDADVTDFLRPFSSLDGHVLISGMIPDLRPVISLRNRDFTFIRYRGSAGNIRLSGSYNISQFRDNFAATFNNFSLFVENYGSIHTPSDLMTRPSSGTGTELFLNMWNNEYNDFENVGIGGVIQTGWLGITRTRQDIIDEVTKQ